MQHASEQKRASNSGRLLAQTIGATIIPYGQKGVPFIPSSIPKDDTRLLFPEGPVDRPLTAPSNLVVIDGSWAQARKIRTRQKALRGIPTLRVEVHPTPMLRKQISEGRGPTALAVAQALALFGEANAARAIREGYQELHGLLRKNENAKKTQIGVGQ